MDKVLSLGYGDDLCEEVGEPDRVDEVEVVQTSEMIVVVEENTIVMEKLGSWGKGRGGENTVNEIKRTSEPDLSRVEKC